jgi:hypothetical protein
VWTYYAGQGVALNWVHAATELKVRLKRRRYDEYRAGVAEALALSTTGTGRTGRTYRPNENWFTTPGDGRRPPWRDAMGTAVLLASLTPAIASDAPLHEREVAQRVAAQYWKRSMSTGAMAVFGGATEDRGSGSWSTPTAPTRGC